MEISAKFNQCVDIFSLEGPTSRIAELLEKHPTAYKITLIFNHLFRAVMMVGLMFVPGIPLYVSMPICFIGSLFYRLTVEKNCAYKFALPAFAGAAAFMLAIPALLNMIHGVAFVTTASGVAACASFLPLLLYGTYVFLTVNHEVNQKLGLLPKQEASDPEQCDTTGEEQCNCHEKQEAEKL